MLSVHVHINFVGYVPTLCHDCTFGHHGLTHGEPLLKEEIGDVDCVEVYQCEGRHSLCAGCYQLDGGQVSRRAARKQERRAGLQ